MSASVSEPGPAGQSPAGSPQVRPAGLPVGLSVIIDSRLDVVRARQVATFVDRLGLAGVWLRQPWWPLHVPVMGEADAAGLLAELAGRERVRAGLMRAGLITGAGKADGKLLTHPG